MTLQEVTREIQRIVGVHVDGVYGPNTARSILGRLKGMETNQIVSISEFDERTNKNLDTLHPKAKKLFIPFVRRAMSIGLSMGVDVKVICGARSKKDQESAFNKGASKAKWGSSWHNYRIAIDLGLFKGGKYIDSSNPDLAWTVYCAIGEVCKEYGIEWGGSWTSFIDAPHFQINMGRSSPNAKDKKDFFNGVWTF